MGLILFSELNCQGKSVALKDKEVNLTKAGVNFPVKVLRLTARSWSVYCPCSLLLSREVRGFYSPPRDFRTSSVTWRTGGWLVVSVHFYPMTFTDTLTC